MGRALERKARKGGKEYLLNGEGDAGGDNGGEEEEEEGEAEEGGGGDGHG